MDNQSLRGIRAMLLAMLLFSMMDAGLKWLSPHYPAIQVAAMRAMASLPLVFAYVVWRGTYKSLFKIRWPLHLLRGALGIAMLALFTYGLRAMPLSEAYTLVFIAPMLITALSVPLLKEKVSAVRWLAIFAGFMGVLVVLRPSGTGLISTGSAALLIAAVCYAISAITVRIISRTDSADSLIFWVMSMTAVGAGVLALPNWQPVLLQHGWVLVGIGISGFLGQIAITHAFQHGEASVIAPFEYSAMAWALMLDWLLWQSLPDGVALLGAGIIIGSGLYLIRKEKVRVEAEHL